MTNDDVAVATPSEETNEERPDRSLAEQLVEQARAPLNADQNPAASHRLPVGAPTASIGLTPRPLGIAARQSVLDPGGPTRVRPNSWHPIIAPSSASRDRRERGWSRLLGRLGQPKEAAMADTETTTVHTAEVVRYDDPVIITERVAVAAYIAGYTDPTRRSYATDLRIFAGWCHDHGINLLNVKRPHLETFARWMEQEGRMASTIGRRLSTLSSFYR